VTEATAAALRHLPSVERVLQHERALALIAEYGRPLALAAVRHALDDARVTLRAGGQAPPPVDAVPDEAGVAAAAAALLAAGLAHSLRPALNATGVIVHTNLGRAPLSRAARAAVDAVAAGYSTLEYDLEEGARGTRSVHAERLLTRITGAEAALVVNNNAAAVLLLLSALAQGREVLISRGQLVEIGGGFRVPDVMRQSGCIVEVGTTNRTHLRDYDPWHRCELLLVIRSNFRIVSRRAGWRAGPAGATAYYSPATRSGALLTRRFGLARADRQETCRRRAVVAFSGDKLLGGPQAGILVGRHTLIDTLKRHPLARAVRADKLTLAALQATLAHYLKDEAVREVPVWRMLAAPLPELEARAARWAAALDGRVLPGESAVGGGSLPGATLPTALVALTAPDPDALAARLRAGDPPLVARIADGALLLDPRTIAPQDDDTLLRCVRAALADVSPPPAAVRAAVAFRGLLPGRQALSLDERRRPAPRPLVSRASAVGPAAGQRRAVAMLRAQRADLRELRARTRGADAARPRRAILPKRADRPTGAELVLTEALPTRPPGWTGSTRACSCSAYCAGRLLPAPCSAGACQPRGVARPAAGLAG
jgi:L-seryl-tRNA(Ser) seleniumtransferase